MKGPCCYKDMLSRYAEVVLLFTHDVLMQCRGASKHWKQIGEKVMVSVDDQTDYVTRLRKAGHMVDHAAKFLSAYIGHNTNQNFGKLF